MEYPLSQVVELMKTKEVYLSAFPRHSNTVPGCRQFIYYDDGTFFQTQYNIDLSTLEEFFSYPEPEFVKLLEQLAFDKVSGEFLDKYEEIPSKLFIEAASRKISIEKIRNALYDDTRWLPLPEGMGWYLHYNGILGWHKIFIKNENDMGFISVVDDASADGEINRILVKKSDIEVEKINQFVIVDLFRKQKQAIKLINSMRPSIAGLKYRDNNLEESVKLLVNDTFYSFIVQNGKPDRLYRTTFRAILEELIGLMISNKAPETFEITPDLQHELTLKLAMQAEV